MQLGADGVEISAHGFCAPDHKDIYKASDDLAAMAARIGEYENKIKDFEKQDAAPIQRIAGDFGKSAVFRNRRLPDKCLLFCQKYLIARQFEPSPAPRDSRTSKQRT